MTKGSNMSVEPIHSLGAVLKGALLLVLFTLGVEIYAQSYNMSESYRISGTTQTTPSVAQGGYGGSMSQGGQASAGGYAMPQGFREVGQKSYNAYQSTVYEPFGNTTPSESSASSRGISGRRNSDYEGDVNLDGWGDPTTANPGDTSDESPIGEPWIMLLFAAAAAVTVAWRKRKVT